MWWIIGLVIAGIYGIAHEILKSLQEEVAVERARWENSYQAVEQEVRRQQQVIEQKLSKSIELLQYREIASLHSASIKVADTTFELLQGAKKTLDAMGRAIVNAAKQRKALEQRKRNSFFGRGDLEKQILALHKLRDEILVPDKDKVKAQRNRLRAEVKHLNRQTAELRELKKRLGTRNQSVIESPRYSQARIEDFVTGVVKWYDQSKGYGFISPSSGGRDIYVNRKQLVGVGYLNKGEEVRFVIRQGNKPWAANVTKVSQDRRDRW